MTQDEVYEEALKPSKKWVEAGNGDIGKVYVEVIACNDLPNLVRVMVKSMHGYVIVNVFQHTLIYSFFFYSGYGRWRLYRSLCGNGV